MSGGPTDGSDSWRPAPTVALKEGLGTGGGGGSEGIPNPCMFTEVTILSSPNSALISTLNVGSILEVEFQETAFRVVATVGGQPAGSITSARLADIIECIRNGQRYRARVIAISGGAVTVEVYPL
jgi:hypothetical protein